MPKLREKQRLVAVVRASLADKARAAAKRDRRSLSNYMANLIEQDLQEQLELPLEGGR